MKIIAFSDTHIKQGSILAQIPTGLVRLIEDADVVIHAGDFVTKEAYDELSGICRLEAVHGNMDEPALKRLLPAWKIIELEKVSFGIIHEAALSIQDTTGAWYMAKELNVDVLVFGHIHRPLIEKSEVLLACPGSPTAPRLSEPAAIEFVIEDDGISGKVITLEGAGCGALESIKDFDKSD